MFDFIFETVPDFMFETLPDFFFDELPTLILENPDPKKPKEKAEREEVD